MNILEELELQYERSAAFLAAIEDETTEFNRLADGKDTQAIRRMKCRVIFSCIESYISHLKQSAIMFSIDRPDLFSPAEILALNDEESYVNGKGEATTRSARIKLQDNLRLAFGSIARALDHDFPIDFGDTEAQCFTESVKIRNRLTHPKQATDLVVNDVESHNIDRAWIYTLNLTEN